MKLVIYRATDAFLYLPTYVAEELGIFDTLLKSLNISKVEFQTSKGDVEAVIDMHKANSETDTISIAIGDPTAFLSLRVREENCFKKDDIRVIGAIINKLSFWAVNHTNTIFHSIEEFKNEFTKVIHYKDDLTTGYYLGNKVKNMCQILNSDAVDFGTEIDVLEIEEEDCKKIAITADIVSVAKGISRDNNPLSINYRFSKPGEDHLTTGILTTVKCCEQYPEILNKIIEGIQKAILIIYSSNKVAEEICEAIAQRPEFNTALIDTKAILKIIDLINEDKFYPGDLNISEEGWRESLTALAKTHQWDDKTEKEILNTSFFKYVNNSFVISAEKSLAIQLGIDLKTFEKELMPLKEEIQQLKQKEKYFSPLLYKIHIICIRILKFFTKIKWVVLSFVTVSAVCFWYIKSNLINDMSQKDWFIIVIGALLTIFLFIYDKHKKKNHNND